MKFHNIGMLLLPILQVSATSDPDPDCSTGIRTESPWIHSTSGLKAICCPAFCGVCGGPQCQGANCCVGGVVSMPSCDVAGPPCVIHGDPACINEGLRADSDWFQENYSLRYACCPKTCGQCGGSGCNSVVNHTAAYCCSGHIANFGDSCDDRGGRGPCKEKFIEDKIAEKLGLQLTPIFQDYFRNGFPLFNFAHYIPYAYKAFQSSTSYNETEASKRYIRDDYHLELKLLPGDINPFTSGNYSARTELLLNRSMYGGTPFEETVFSVTTYFQDEDFDATFFQITQPDNTVPLFTLEVNNREPWGRFIQVRYRTTNSTDPTGAKPVHFPETISGVFRNYTHNLNREVRWDMHFLPSLDPTQGFIKVYRDGLLVWKSEDVPPGRCVYTAGWFEDDGTPYSASCQGESENPLNVQMGVYSFSGKNVPYPPEAQPMTIKLAHFGIYKVEN